MNPEWRDAYKQLAMIEQMLVQVNDDYFCKMAEALNAADFEYALKGSDPTFDEESELLDTVSDAVEAARGIIHRCKDVMKGIGFHVLDRANAPDFAKRCLLLPIGSSPEHEESRMILKFLEWWDCYDLKNADLPETRLERFNEIMEKWRQGHDINVERELVSWLQNFDESSLARLAQFIKHSK